MTCSIVTIYEKTYKMPNIFMHIFEIHFLNNRNNKETQKICILKTNNKF